MKNVRVTDRAATSRIRSTSAFGTLLQGASCFGASVPGTALLWALLLGASATPASGEEPVDFNRDIRPLLSDRCYQCHGPDEYERQAGLRFDDPDAALDILDSGDRAIVPGDLELSIMIDRITTDDPDLVMPPEESNKSLSERDIELLTRWVKEGARFNQHWAFVSPVRPSVPTVDEETRYRNEIDAFIARKLLERELSQSEEADKETLIRRVTFDLTGLPPTIEEIDAFLADDSPDAYERVVDRLLESPRYGENMTRYWLDAARYGDTHGLHLDNMRQIWPYRDWVIRAFNDNMPFDQFTIEQLAGDLVTDPTIDQLVATGFNRCNVTTSEGGSINEEYRVRYAVDRVETTSTVFMGLTTGCAVCHEHKFDPISQTEFYQLYAYFYNFAEREMDGNALLPPPVAAVPDETYEARKAEIQSNIAAINERIQAAIAEVKYVEPNEVVESISEPYDFVWIEDQVPAGAKPEGNTPWRFVTAGKHQVLSGGVSTYRQANGLSQHFFTGATQQLVVGEGDKLFAYVYLDPTDPPRQVMLQFNDGSSWDHRAFWGENLIEWGTTDQPSRLSMGELPKSGEWVRLEVAASAVGLNPGAKISGWAFTQYDGSVYWDKSGIRTKTQQDGNQFKSVLAWEDFVKSTGSDQLPNDVKAALEIERDDRDESQQQRLLNYFVEFAYTDSRETFSPLHTELMAAKTSLQQLEESLPKTLVMGDKPVEQWQPVYLLTRGQYDTPDKEQQVAPAVPAILPPLPDGTPANRLGLAKWLVNGRHPLTARVTVNRFWQQLFGTGIVKTSEDFGSQGEFPTHPMLLDWLAVEFVESGWDMKHMMKLMVMSHAYRQSAVVIEQHLEVDAANRFLARGPRFRLDAEAIRDSALYVSDLLVEKQGGPSVKPYQPLGLWKAVGYTSSNTANFKQDHGASLYRRSMYIFWKRTSPPPTMQILDAPSREFCVVRRERTNTPAGALVTLNDVQFVEAARCFAERIVKEGGDSVDERIEFAFRSATGRRPDSQEKGVLVKLQSRMAEHYAQHEEAAMKLASTGERPRDESLPAGEIAAWTIIASTILNLDETLNK